MACQQKSAKYFVQSRRNTEMQVTEIILFFGSFITIAVYMIISNVSDKHKLEKTSNSNYLKHFASLYELRDLVVEERIKIELAKEPNLKRN